MIDVSEAVEAVAEATAGSTRARRSPLRVVLAAVLTTSAVAVLTVCITGGAESVADQSPTPASTASP